MQRTVIILACFFICANCFAQQYPFVHYTPKDGLVNSRVKKTYQDSKGRMYFLTYGGLSVYDGVRFKNYTKETGLVTDVVNDILEVGDDSILVATNLPVLNALVRGKIVTIKTEGISCPLINQFYKHDNNNIYLSSDNGLFILENKKIRELNVSLLSKSGPGLPYLGGITGSGNYLVLTTNEMKSLKGLFLYDIINNRICDELLNANALLAGKDKRNRVWINMDHKLFVLDEMDLAKGKISLTLPPGSFQAIKDYSIANIAFDKDHIWLVHRNENLINKEILCIDESGGMSRIPLPEPTTTPGLRNIMIDREHTIWLSNDGEGIFKIANSPLLVFEKPFDAKGQIDRSFHSNNATWFNSYSTSGYSNKLFKSSEDGIKAYNCNIDKSPIIFYADDKTLLGQDFTHIYRADNFFGKKKIEFHPVISASKPVRFGINMLVDPNGNWIINEIINEVSGLSVWINNQKAFRLPIYKEDVIEEIFIDKKNFLWLVKRYTGIEVFTLHPENISNYLQTAFRFSREQISGSPRSFVIDKNGLIWIGTRDDGLFGYEQNENQLKSIYHFNISNGLTDNFVTELACDSMNNIIVGTQTGLDRIVFISKDSWRAENLSRNSNFFGFINQTWADAKYAYALTNTGVLLQVSTAAKTEKKNTPPLLLEEIRMNAQPIVTHKNKFRYKENNISFFMAAPSFIDEKQIAYSYIVEGSGNKQWSDTSAANSVINLTNLSPGKYSLNVKAFFPSATYQPAEFSYSFEITPPWWQTWWFKTIAGLTIIGLLVFGFRFYYRRRLERQMAASEKQQAIEKERTRIATDMHDDLGAGLSRIKFLSQSLLNKRKDEGLKTELEKITSFSDEMSEKMGEIIWALNEKNDSLADLIAYTRSYAVEYLANHNIECEAKTPLHLTDTFLTGEIRRNIFLSVKECLHNIVKHAEATKVSFYIELNKNMHIVIHDNGKGIDWDNQRKFSNGLQNMEKRMKEIEGKVNFQNDQGTKVSLTVPLNL